MTYREEDVRRKLEVRRVVEGIVLTHGVSRCRRDVRLLERWSVRDLDALISPSALASARRSWKDADLKQLDDALVKGRDQER